MGGDQDAAGLVGQPRGSIESAWSMRVARSKQVEFFFFEMSKQWGFFLTSKQVELEAGKGGRNVLTRSRVQTCAYFREWL